MASGGTATHLEELGLDVTRVEEVTQAPEMLGGRVKTLHPRIHARRSSPAATATTTSRRSRSRASSPFDLVCVNLYPFRAVVARFGIREEEAVEMIDVGGPSMLRAAAKNFAHVAAVSRPDRYGFVLDELRASGEVSQETRRELAAETFATTATYEATIAGLVRASAEAFPETIVPGFEKVLDLAYGENPHQRAAYYAESGARRHLLSRVEQLHGKELSYNNLNDLSAARLLVREFTVPACVIVKHANPCGVAMAATIEEAYERALAADPVSAYGGVVVAQPAGERRRSASGSPQQFVEVLFAPGLRGRGARGAARQAVHAHPRRPRAAPRQPRRARLQARPRRPARPGPRLGDRGPRGHGRRLRQPEREPVGRPPVRVARVPHVTSNAIVIAKDLQTIGIGAGQMSRVDSVRIALEKAAEHGHDTTGAVLASDAFFPFADGPQLALEAGRDGDHPAGRLEARRRGGRGRRQAPARRWCSRTAATSGTSEISAATRYVRGRQPPEEEPVTAVAADAVAVPDPRRWKALALVCVAFFMTVLDVSIVNVALPSIARSLDFSHDRPAVGRHGVRDHVRRLPAPRRPRCRPARPAAACS